MTALVPLYPFPPCLTAYNQRASAAPSINYYNSREMSSDAAMFSDDDRPFVAKSDLIGHDDNVPINVNGHVNGAGQQEAYMSEDEDDDMPLVCPIFLSAAVYASVSRVIECLLSYSRRSLLQNLSL